MKRWREDHTDEKKKTEKKILKKDWKKCWKVNLLIWKIIDVSSLKCNMLKLHKNLQKMKSILIIQIRTKYIKLTVFLNKIKIFRYEMLTCQCNQVRKTVTYVIIHCFRFAETKHLLENSKTGQLDLQVLTDTSAETQWLACWFMRLWILSQFQLAEQLLYRNKDKTEKI